MVEYLESVPTSLRRVNEGGCVGSVGDKSFAKGPTPRRLGVLETRLLPYRPWTPVSGEMEGTGWRSTSLFVVKVSARFTF